MPGQPIDRRRIEEVFLAALEREPAERAAFLDGACFGEPEARALVENLLRHAQDSEDFLVEPPFGTQVRLDDLMDSETAAGALTDPGIDDPLGPEGPAGRRIGSYVLREELGRGGQGHVYLAHDERLERDVALKLLPETLSYSERARRRFEREATAASQLDHPGICTVYEIGEEKGVPFIAMQYVEGVTLQQRIDETAAGGPPADCAELVRFAELAALALHAAHEKGLIHRDVKPANIMVTPGGEPVILDFGLAHQDPEEEATATKPDGLMGTPAYMSPEQVDPRGREIDRRTDVYSLGATLLEALTLRRPFAGQTSRDLYLAALSQELPDPRKLNPAIPRDLAVVTQKAMAKEPEQRYATALELAEDLGRIRRFEPIQARPPSAAYRLSRFYRRNQAACTAALLGLAVVTSLFAWFAVLDPWLERRVALGVERRELLAIVEQKRLAEDEARAQLARAQSAFASDPELARSIAAEMEQTFRDRDRALPTLPAGLRFESEHRADRELAEAFEPYRLHLSEAALLVAELCHASDELADRTQARTEAASRAFTWATSRDALLDEERALAALIHLGNALYESGRFSQAGVTFQGALSSLPSAHDSASVFFGLGRALQAQQEFAESAGAFARAIELGLELEHGGALARYAERALAIQGALLPEREFDLVEGLPVGTGDLDGDGVDELVCYDRDGNLFAYALSGGGGRPLPRGRRVGRGRWLPVGEEVTFETSQTLVADVCGDERQELVLAWANPVQGIGRISVFSLTADGRLEEIAWSSCKDDIGDLAAVDVDGDGARELWIGHGYFGRTLDAFRVPGGVEATGGPIEMEPFFQQALGSDVDSFLFGDFDPDRDGLELALVLGAWTYFRIALGHVDLSAGRLHITAVTDGNVCGAETSLHGCAWEPSAFLVLHTYTDFSIENFQLEGLPLLPMGLLLARPGAGVLPPPTPLVRGGARVEGQREPMLRHSSILSCNLRGVGPSLAWLEEGTESDRMRVTPAAAAGGSLATPILIDSFAGSDLLSGDLDGDGFDEVLAMKPSAPGRPRRIRVLGLDDETQRAVEPYGPGIAGPSVQRSQKWPKRLMKLGCYREAVAAYEHALSGAKPPERHRIETELAACYVEMGSLRAAAATYARAAESGSGDEASRALFAQAEVLVELRSWEDARDVLAALDERYLSPGEDARLRALEDEVESALDLAEAAPLTLAGPRVPLVENPLATTIAGDSLVLRASSTRAPRLAIPLVYRGRMFELHFDVEPLRADWQTYATVTLGAEPFFTGAADSLGPNDLARSRPMIQFEADGATANPTRWVTVRAADAIAEAIPADLDPGDGFRYELGRPVHVQITFLPASAKLQVDLSNERGEVVQRDWFELKRPFGPRRRIWLQFGMGAFQSTPGGHYNEFHVRGLELRARNLRPVPYEPRSLREHLAVANGHFARGELEAAIAGYEAVFVGLAEASDEDAQLQAECHFWRGMARERTEPGTGRDDVLAAFELAPGVGLALVEGAWPGMTAPERTLVAQLFEEHVLRGRTELTLELLAELGLEPLIESGAEDRPLYVLAPAVGLEVLFALFSSMPEVAAQRALVPAPAQDEEPTLETACLQAELVFNDLDPTAGVETIHALIELVRNLTACNRDGHEHAEELRTCLDLALATIDALPGRTPAPPGLLLYFAHVAMNQAELDWCDEFLARCGARDVQDPALELEAQILTARVAAKRAR